MANEIEANAPTGKTIYALLRNATGSIWNGANFVPYVTANLATYTIAMTEQGTASGFYTGNMPAIAAGIYSATAHIQAGGGAAETDLDVAEGDIQWDGSLVLPLSSVPIASVQLTLVTSMVQTLLQQDISGSIENAAAVHSLATAVLKLVSKFNLDQVGNVATTFKTDGITAKMQQAITKNAALVATQTLGVGA